MGAGGVSITATGVGGGRRKLIKITFLKSNSAVQINVKNVHSDPEIPLVGIYLEGFSSANKEVHIFILMCI